MPNIAELFSQKNVISYMQQRQYPTMLGETLFPSRKVPSLDVEILENNRSTPVIAPMSTFDVEAEIGSREANITA
ncbi:major capsid protein, partial [Lactobacillus sp. XV13L]|nr:major capsid protein [Lactobacillus sp. XV13L]